MFGHNLRCVLRRDTCGSEPAREGGVSVTKILTDRMLSRAGSLPQGIVSYSAFEDLVHDPIGLDGLLGHGGML